MKYLIVVGASLLLAGCEARFRYPCQDPANWHTEECSKPICEINQTCPEHIFKNKVIVTNE